MPGGFVNKLNQCPAKGSKKKLRSQRVKSIMEICLKIMKTCRLQRLTKNAALIELINESISIVL